MISSSTTLFKRLLLSVLVGATAVSLAADQDKLPTNWDGPLLKPVEREAVYEFSRTPTLRKAGPDRYEIRFASKGKCDVAVAVEDASGRIVRHIVYGVLGSNAPAPLQKDSLEQTLVWDGKDEFGKYVKAPETCRVRVSLGLNPTFDKLIGWHPKDTSERRCIHGIVATTDGVYVLERLSFGNHNLRHYDHNANYVKTVYPWDPDKLDRIDIPKRTLPDAKMWRNGPPPADSRYVPVLHHYGAAEPFGVVQDPTCMAVAAGKIAVFTQGGHGDLRRLLRLRTDGTTGGEALVGGLFTPPNTPVPSFAGQGHIALSPDGKWVYVTGQGRSDRQGRNRDMRLERPPYTWNAVFRFGWDDTGVVVQGKDALVGEVSRDAKVCGAGSDNEHLNNPQGLACDSRGRLYVADHGNNRIQVFSPEGKHIKTIRVQEPQEISVHPKTGEIYILCFRRHFEGGVQNKAAITLIKFGPLDDPVERMQQTFSAVIPGDPREMGHPVPLLAVDGWATETRIWLVHESGVIRVYAERGKKWELFDDFEADVRRDGHTPHAMHGKKMGYLCADPVRGHLYRISTRTRKTRIDPEEGKTWQWLNVGGLAHSVEDSMNWEDAVVGWNGLLYARTLKYVARFNPDKFPATGPIVLSAASEYPFDYGVEKHVVQRKAEESAKLRGVIDVSWAMGGANGYNNGIGVSTRGDVMILTENYPNLAELLAGQKKAEGTLDNLERRGKEDLKGGSRYHPASYPGRPGSGNFLWRWNARGEVVAADPLPGLPVNSTFGIRMAPDGNYIIGLGGHQNVDGAAHIGGSVTKFAAKGGKLFSEHAPVKLDPLPRRPPDFFGNGRMWAQNLFWSVPGLDQLNFVGSATGNYPCQCYHCRFDTDPYGRTFMPRAYAYHVQVVDQSGNRICQIGRFGNADKPAMKPGSPDIGFGQCSYLTTVSDRWLYIADDSNLRIIRVKLGYHAEKRIEISGK